MPVVLSEVQERLCARPAVTSSGLGRRELRLTSALLLVALFTAGCGQRGPLYLPRSGPVPLAASPATTTGSVPLVTVPLFPVVPLTSDPTASPAAVSSFDTVPGAPGAATYGSESDQPGLKVTPDGP